MTLMRAAVLRPGDWVRYDGEDHQVIALAGTSVRLRSELGAESVVLVAYLMASPEFAVIDGAPTPSVEPFGLMDGPPVKALEQARGSATSWRWRRGYRRARGPAQPRARALTRRARRSLRGTKPRRPSWE